VYRRLHLLVLTPTETLLDVDALAWVQLKLADGGGLGIYPGHAPLLAETVAGPLHYATASGEETSVDLPAGVLQICDHEITVFTLGELGDKAGIDLEKDAGLAQFERLSRALLAALQSGASDSFPDKVSNGES